MQSLRRLLDIAQRDSGVLGLSIPQTATADGVVDGTSNVRSWHKADIQVPPADVRFRG
jgi:hypothetical protein